MKGLRLKIAHESWPIAGSFTISRGSKKTAEVVVVTLEKDGLSGHGECVPYARYGETIDGVVNALEAARAAIEDDLDHERIAKLVGPKAACNALDCALWDLRAKHSGRPAWALAGLAAMKPVVTAYTLSLETADKMAKAAAAAAAAGRPLLKIKLGGEGDHERLRAIRAAAPDIRLIIDANEGWSRDGLQAHLDVCAEVGIELIEQPLPADDDDILLNINSAVPICADESAHDRHSLAGLIGKYDAVNIKLDKTGGLSEALAFAAAARNENMQIMVGCMLATSLAMAPAMLVAQGADIVDLDGPLLLAQDRDPGIEFTGSTMAPPPAALWG